VSEDLLELGRAVQLDDGELRNARVIRILKGGAF
jgi:hypothetical protein